MSKPIRDRIFASFEDEGHIFLVERVALDKYVKGYRRRWDEQRVCISRDELRNLVRQFLNWPSGKAPR